MPRFVIANRHPLNQPVAMVRAAGLVRAGRRDRPAAELNGERLAIDAFCLNLKR